MYKRIEQKILSLAELSGFELVRENCSAKIFERSEENGSPQAKKFFGFTNHFMKNAKRFNQVLRTNLVEFGELNSFFAFLCLIKLQLRTFRRTEI